MNYTERKQAICEKCEGQEVCGFYFTPEREECEYLQNVMEGCKLGQQDTLVAVEDYVDRGNSVFTEEFMNGLKQKLED